MRGGRVARKIDWTAIKTEYITTDKTSYRHLASKYKVSQQSISARGKKESWVELRKNNLSKTRAKVEQILTQKNIDAEVDRITSLLNLTDKAQEQINIAFGQLCKHMDMFGNVHENDIVDVPRLKKLISALKDIKQFVLGKSRTVNGKHFDGTEDTTSPLSGKNVVDSLDEYGCLHFETRIICGVDEPAFTTEERERLDAENKRPIEIDGVTKTGYEWKQTMRRLERAGKEAKLKRETFKAAGNNTEARNQSQRLKAIEEKYQLIADKTGIKAQYEKMAIVKGKMSISKPQHHIEGNVVEIKGNNSSALTKQLAKELMEQANIFENKFGTLTKLTEIRPMRYDNDGVWGGYNDNSGVLSLYGIGRKNGKNTMVKVAKEMNKQGKWSTASPYHAFRHELGHAWLDQQEKTSTYNEKILSIKKIKEDILLKLTNNEEIDKIIMKNNLCTYGLTPEAEIDAFFCECLAEYEMVSRGLLREKL